MTIKELKEIAYIFLNEYATLWNNFIKPVEDEYELYLKRNVLKRRP